MRFIALRLVSTWPPESRIVAPGTLPGVCIHPKVPHPCLRFVRQGGDFDFSHSDREKLPQSEVGWSPTTSRPRSLIWTISGSKSRRGTNCNTSYTIVLL